MEIKNLPVIKVFSFRDFSWLYLAEICFYLPSWMAAMVFGLIATHIKGNSPFFVGLIGFGFNFPMLFGTLIGVYVDRFQRIRILQIVSMIIFVAAISMALLLFNSFPNFWLMFGLVLVYGIANSFFYITIIPSVSDVVSDTNLVSNGVSLVNATNRIVMFFGYSLGGLLISLFSEQFTFWFNAVLFLLCIIFLSLITAKVKLPSEKRSAMTELKTGFNYLKESKTVRAVMIVLLIQGLLAWPYLFQIPVVNRYYLGGTPVTLGLLLGISGLGGTIGSFVMSLRKHNIYLTYISIGIIILLALAFILLSVTRSVGWAYIVLFALDFFLMMSLTVSMIFIQQVVPKELQGRIFGIVGMVAFGTIPIGSVIFYGTVGELFGIMHAFLYAAIIIAISGFWFAFRAKHIRAEVVDLFVEKKLINDKTEIYKI